MRVNGIMSVVMDEAGQEVPSGRLRVYKGSLLLDTASESPRRTAPEAAVAHRVAGIYLVDVQMMGGKRFLSNSTFVTLAMATRELFFISPYRSSAKL